MHEVTGSSPVSPIFLRTLFSKARRTSPSPSAPVSLLPAQAVEGVAGFVDDFRHEERGFLEHLVQ